MKFNDFVDGVKWHMSNNIPLHESVYRFGSDKYFETFAEARKLYNEGKLQNLHEWDEELLRDTDLGKFVNVKGVGRVPLDMPISEEEHLRFEADNDEKLKGFNPELQYAIKKLQARYPHAQDVLSALLADVEKNEKDSDVADSTHEKRIADLEQKVNDLIKKNELKEEFEEPEYGIIRYPDTSISYVINHGDSWTHLYDPSYGYDGEVDDEDLKYLSIINKEKVPSRLTESDNELEYNGKLHPSIDFTSEHDDPSFCYDCKLVSTTHGEIDTEHDEADVVCPRCGSQAYVEASPEEIDKYASPEAWMNEAEYQGKKVQLSKPKRGGSKKFYVYVMNPKTKKVKKVSFGAAGGGGNLAVKLKDPKARKAFADRHNCDQKNDKTKPGYWSCRLPRYAKSLGLSGGGTWW